MMTYIFSISFLLVAITTDIKAVVQEFHELETRSDELKFIEKHIQSNEPSILAYVISIQMKQAEYGINPYKKLKIFNTNKNKINELIRHHKSNVHLRYVRLLAQENAPWFLGYNNFIKEDKSFLIQQLNIIDSSDFLDSYIKANTSL